MTSGSRVALAIATSAILLLLVPARPAHAGWSASPVEVRAGAPGATLIAAVDDARGGAIVAWQEQTPLGWWLYAERLTAEGDLDPDWIHPVPFCQFDARRSVLGAVADGLGGAYLWWMEGNQLFLSRLTPSGFVANGFPARGIPLGPLAEAEEILGRAIPYRPTVRPDGSHGVLLGWLRPAVGTDPPEWRVARFGPDGAPAVGWPADGRAILPYNPGGLISGAVDMAPDGGIWVALEPAGALEVQRLLPSGEPAPGWESGPIALELVDLAYLGPATGWNLSAAPVAVACDGSGGVYVFTAHGFLTGLGLELHPRLRRLAPDGSPSTGWSVDGLELPASVVPSGVVGTPEASVRATTLSDDVEVVWPTYPAGVAPRLQFQRFDAAGATGPWSFSSPQQAVHLARRDDGGVLATWCDPVGTLSTAAEVGFAQSAPGSPFADAFAGYPGRSYGDAAVASTRDGGAIVAWSQFLGSRQGVYAVRVNRDGLVTGVPPATSPTSLRAWFARGEGVRLAGAVGRMTLHDLTGRAVASASSAAGATAEWTLPGTAALPSGMYFVRAVEAGREARLKVVVLR